MPQLKKPIDSIEQMTCEHCIHFQQTPKCGEPYCINPDSDDWDRDKGDCCSIGMWFKVIQYDDETELELYGYSFLMQIFAQEQFDAAR